ncbi:MAG: YggT family protein [Clostridia bacterium]|nr:YggT family protein [Clostridia bacterium]MBR6574375.1 YggT family protein [Clostridia bacterium]
MGTLNMLARSLAGMLINLLQTLMLIMALMSWVPQLRQSKIYYAISMIVEPVIDPFRRLLYKIPGMDRFPLDLSFLAAWMVLSLLAGLL